MAVMKIMEFFYEKTAVRIREKIKTSGLKYEEIYPSDYKMLSSVVKNKRDEKNPYLIRDGMIDSYYTSKKGEYEKVGFLNKLNFESIKEILWGTDSEIENYLPDLFNVLFEETFEFDFNNAYNSESEFILYDYIPYAKYSAYWKIFFLQKNSYKALDYGIYEDTIANEIDPSREIAIQFLYRKCEKQFAKAFDEFAENTLSYNKIPNVFKKTFIDKEFIPMLNEIKRNMDEKYSLGLRVRNLIINDLSKSALMINGETVDHETCRKKLVKASSEYICELEKIQNEMEIMDSMDV